MQQKGMVLVPGGTFQMGSDRHYPEEGPSRRQEVGAFWMDRTPVTNAAFARFVAETGHVTLAEIVPDATRYPGLLPEMAVAGSIVFQSPQTPMPLHPSSWWGYVPGANWRLPYGPDGTQVGAIPDHPVVHVALADALAYCEWAGKALPSEAEWEYAARGKGLDYAWGSDLEPGGRQMANYWRSGFPYRGSTTGGAPYTTPVGRFPANERGLVDMIGNVWEWTATDFNNPDRSTRSCCASSMNEAGDMRKVLKGGSHLCAPEYCRRYRPAARIPQEADSGASHIGFRCIVRA